MRGSARTSCSRRRAARTPSSSTRSRRAKALGIPSVVLVYNWDNLSSKGASRSRPTTSRSWGEQSVATPEIHGLPRERVAVLGAPALDSHFRHGPGTTQSPFPFRYALFAGCYVPFDERSRCSASTRRSRSTASTSRSSTARIRTGGGAIDDLVDESRFRHVVLDPRFASLPRAFDSEGGNADAAAARLLPRAARARRVRDLPAVDDGARGGDLRAAGDRHRLRRRHPPQLAGRRRRRTTTSTASATSPGSTSPTRRRRWTAPSSRSLRAGASVGPRCATRWATGCTTTSARTPSAWRRSSARRPAGACG